MARRAFELAARTATERILSGLYARLADHATELAGKRVLITGSTRGVGKAAAAGFARCGAKVIIHGRREVDACEIAAALSRNSPVEAVGLAADLTVAGAGRALVERALQRVGGLDIIINNAAVHDPKRKPIWATSSEEMRLALTVNLLGAFDTAAAGIESMLERQIAGRVINISSPAAAPGGMSARGIASYGISKVALEGLSSYLAAELRGGIAVATLRLAAIETDMTKPLFAWDERWLMLPPGSVVPALVYLATSPSVRIHGKVFEQMDLLRELAQNPGGRDLPEKHPVQEAVHSIAADELCAMCREALGA
jgi:3-oxoacyl-[acyl-carrier protein] reductase